MKDRYGVEIDVGDAVVFVGPYERDATVPNFITGHTGRVLSIGNSRVRVRIDDPRFHGRVLSPRSKSLMVTGVYNGTSRR